MRPEPPPAPCTICGQPSDDLLYRIGHVPAEATICGECKVKIGREMFESAVRRLYDAALEHARKKL